MSSGGGREAKPPILPEADERGDLSLLLFAGRSAEEGEGTTEAPPFRFTRFSLLYLLAMVGYFGIVAVALAAFLSWLL